MNSFVSGKEECSLAYQDHISISNKIREIGTKLRRKFPFIRKRKRRQEKAEQWKKETSNQFYKDGRLPFYCCSMANTTKNGCQENTRHLNSRITTLWLLLKRAKLPPDVSRFSIDDDNILNPSRHMLTFNNLIQFV